MAELREFFKGTKFKIRGISESSVRKIRFKPKRRFPQGKFSDLKNAQEVQEKVRDLASRYPGSVYDKALYAYRSLDVSYPEVYLIASLRDPRVKEEAAKIKTIGEAVDFIRDKVPSRESVLGTVDRIALPDETLIFKTGSNRDKALLLYALLYHMKSAKYANLAIYFAKDNSYVYYNGLFTNTSNWKRYDRLPEEEIATMRENQCIILQPDRREVARDSLRTELSGQKGSSDNGKEYGELAETPPALAINFVSTAKAIASAA